MRINVIALPDHLPNPYTGTYNESQPERYDMLVDMAVKADRGGFDGFWLGEHHANFYIVPSPQLLLATIAGKTSRIKLGSGITLAPNCDPVRVAEEFAMLDVISKGRAQLGFGSGGHLHTFALFGQDPANQLDESFEKIHLVEQLWAEDHVTWKGRFRSPIEHIKVEPRPYENRRIPIMRATAGSGRSMAAARDAGLRGHKLSALTVLGDKFSNMKEVVDIYRTAYKEGGHDPAGMSVSANTFVYVGQNGEAARQHWRPYINNYVHLTTADVAHLGIGPWMLERAIALGITGDMEGVMRQCEMCGDPDEVLEMIHKGSEDLGGVEEMNFIFDSGGIPQAEVMCSMDLFIEKVLPRAHKLGL